MASIKRSGPDYIHFSFEDPIEVLEPGGQTHAYFGKVLPLPSNRVGIVLRARRNEFLVGIIAAAVSIILLVLTTPWVESLLYGVQVNPGTWAAWSKGFLERLGTSAIVTWTVSWLNVLLYWFQIRQASIIQWTLE